MADEKVIKESTESELKEFITTSDVENLSNEELKKYLCEYIDRQEKMDAEFDKVLKDAVAYKDSWYRVSADFENFRKRNQDIRLNAYKDGKVDVITKILVVGDNLERALTMPLDEKTKQGIELVLRQYKETLQSLDVTEINPLGEQFNPETSEAVMKAPMEEGDTEGTVKQVFLKGYKLGDKIIRYAQVVVVG